jgi:hypothetical protein
VCGYFKIEQAPATKRAIDTTERQDNKKKAKQEKREAFVADVVVLEQG